MIIDSSIIKVFPLAKTARNSAIVGVCDFETLGNAPPLELWPQELKAPLGVITGNFT